MKRIGVIVGLLIGVIAGLCPGVSHGKERYDEIIVNFVDKTTQETVERIAQTYGIALEYNSIFSEDEMLMRFPIGGNIAGDDTLLHLMAKLTAEKVIEYAEPNYIYQNFFTPNDPMYDKQWNMSMLHMEDAWELADGKGAVVAVIDTGVAYENYKDKRGTYHRVPDLAETTFVQGYDFIDNDEHANDDNGHGTHVAGTIAQSTHNKTGVAGIAYKAAIMPLKVLNRYGQGNIADISEAITYAADHGAHVINMSLGGAGENRLMREAIEYAHKKGVTIICAAGNESLGRASYPAAYPYAIGVSSVGPDETLAPYSNYGPGVDIAAPGGSTKTHREHGILQNTIGRMDPAKDSYEFFQGTSMAAPHVAGVAALLVSVGIHNPTALEEVLFQTASPKDDASKYGAGIVDALAALKSAKGTTGSAVASSSYVSPQHIKESILYFLAGVGFAIFYFKLMKRSDGYGPLFSFLFSLAMFLSSSGLFFLDFARFSFLPNVVIDVLSLPFANLDRVFLNSSHATLNPIFHSALVPFLLIVVLLHTKWGNVIAIGFALGMASHLFVDAVFSCATVSYIPGSFLLDKAWLLLNGVFCFGLALLAGKNR